MIVFLLLVVGQVCERQTLVNCREYSRFYVQASFSDGYTTTVPIINGNSPTITKFGCGQVVELVLDYKAGILCCVGEGGCVHYVETNESLSSAPQQSKSELPSSKPLISIDPLDKWLSLPTEVN